MSETKAHLITLHTYISKYLYDKPGSQCIRNELLTTYFEGSCDDKVIQTNKSCPRCFSMWNEGNFLIQTKSKQPKKLHSQKTIIMKCSVCNKRCVLEHSSKQRSSRKNRKVSNMDSQRVEKKKLTTKTRKRKVKVMSESHPNRKANACFVKNTNRKKVALNVLNDLL